jgi:trehalose-6-phosphatase
MHLEHLKDEAGRSASPQLPEGVKNYLIDIDGTITEDVPNEEPDRMATVEPYAGAVETLNRWAAEGHVITFFTSRTEAHRAVTEAWLTQWGFVYHGLLMAKPRGGNYHWIDNHIVRGTRYEGTWSDLIRVERTIEVFPGQ